MQGKSDAQLKDEDGEIARDHVADQEQKPTPKKESIKLGLTKNKKIKTPKKEKGGRSRFLGEGISFKAKLIGVEEIDEARGDKLCQETLSRLKQVVKTSGTHKQRISLTISLSGVKLKEEKSGAVMYHHPVHHISFISQDVGDDRAFGYICSPTPTSFHFVAIKTEKAASQVVITLRDLFQTVLDMKKQQKLQREETLSNSFDSERSTTSEEPAVPSTSSTPEPTKANHSRLDSTDTSEPIYEDLSQFGESQKKENAERVAQVNDLLTGDLLDLNFDVNVEHLQQSIAQMNFSLSAVTPASLSPMLVNVVPNTQPNDPDPASPVPSPEPDPIEAPAPEHSPPTHPPQQQEKQPYIDRYAVFEEIDNAPSIFENPAIIDLPLFPPEPNYPIRDIPTEPSPSILDDPLPPSLPPRAKTLSIFAELDPLGKDRPLADRKTFFQDIKNPPKKVLKDLMGNNILQEAANQSPPTFTEPEPIYAKINKIKKRAKPQPAAAASSVVTLDAEDESDC